MIWETIIGGFGGQGLLFAGKILAHAAMLQDLEVTWLPSYGPQMRGGTANCLVIISDQPIHSPLARHPRGLIALNRPSVDEFGPRLHDDGVMIVNSSLVDGTTELSGVRSVMVPATEIARRLGNARAANMVALGAYLRATNLVSTDCIRTALEKAFPASQSDVRELNMKAYLEGRDFAGCGASSSSVD